MLKVKIQKDNIYDFNAREELNPNIWDGEKLRVNVREMLIKIAKEFVSFLNVDINWEDIQDVILTGSLANYNYTKYSDIDLHILIDFSSIYENSELVKEYLMSKKFIWINKHDIKIKGYEVEIYPQDPEEVHHSKGIYSILNDEWNIKPSLPRDVWSRVNVQDIKKKAKDISKQIETLEYSLNLKDINRIKQKIKRMRKSGLERHGEYSTENLVFKVLRRSGDLAKLYDYSVRAYDKSFSLNGF